MARINLGRDLGHMIDFEAIPKNAIIIDAGVCKGDFIDELDNRLDIKKFTIIGFEPSITNIEFVRSKFKNNKNIHLEDKAIVGKDFPNTIKFYEYRNAGLEEWGNVMGLYQDSAKQKNATQIEYSVETITIEKIFNLYDIPHIDYLKMDIEGTEFNLVETLTQETANKINQLSMEVHEDSNDAKKNKEAIMNNLIKLGFDVHFELGELYGCRK
tara:strand:+ start:4315 stop:4953 length:639 start_codon:yes stop_codon:yes gene_type:complete